MLIIINLTVNKCAVFYGQHLQCLQLQVDFLVFCM